MASSLGQTLPLSAELMVTRLFLSKEESSKIRECLTKREGEDSASVSAAINMIANSIFFQFLPEEKLRNEAAKGLMDQLTALSTSPDAYTGDFTETEALSIRTIALNLFGLGETFWKMPIDVSLNQKQFSAHCREVYDKSSSLINKELNALHGSQRTLVRERINKIMVEMLPIFVLLNYTTPATAKKSFEELPVNTQQTIRQMDPLLKDLTEKEFADFSLRVRVRESVEYRKVISNLRLTLRPTDSKELYDAAQALLRLTFQGKPPQVKYTFEQVMLSVHPELMIDFTKAGSEIQN